MPRRMRIIKLSTIALMTACALWIGLHGAIRGKELRRRLVCASNIKGIGTTAKIYRATWDGTTPIIDWLVQTGQIDPRSAKCPCAESPNYVVVMTPLGAENGDNTVDNRRVIAYEPKSNHGEGGNVLFADGHAGFVRATDYDELIRSVDRTPP